jgi:hypothetical protein
VPIDIDAVQGGIGTLVLGVLAVAWRKLQPTKFLAVRVVDEECQRQLDALRRENAAQANELATLRERDTHRAAAISRLEADVARLLAQLDDAEGDGR